MLLAVLCRGNLFFSSELQQYTMPFMGSDPSVVKRTQRFLVEQHQETPVSRPLCVSLIITNTIDMFLIVVIYRNRFCQDVNFRCYVNLH